MNQKLIALRKGLRWSQARLAQELGISQASVCRIENGEQEPSKSVQKLIEVLLIRYGGAADYVVRQPAEAQP